MNGKKKKEKDEWEIFKSQTQISKWKSALKLVNTKGNWVEN